MSQSTQPACPPTTTDEVTDQRVRWLNHALAIAAALVPAFISLFLFTRSNDFPVNYHPDEQSKVGQIAPTSQPRNFNHPLLMLETANIVRRASGADIADARQVAVAGRCASAGLASVAVFALALLGYVLHSYVGLLVCGLTAALCPPLLVYAHYFKEDTALIAGIAVSIMGAGMLMKSRGIGQQTLAAVVLGIGCAATISAKYVGLVILLPCLICLLVAPGWQWKKFITQTAVFLLVTFVATLLINARAFSSFLPLQLKPEARDRIIAEFRHGTTGQNEVTFGKPNLFCLRITAGELMPHIWLFALVGGAWALARGRISRWALIYGAFIGTWVMALSFSAIPFPRHALPITVLGYFLAAQMVAYAINDAKALKPQPANVALIASLACIVVLQGWRCMQFNEQFRDDSRQRLREWIARNVPPGSGLATERYAVLEGPGDPWRFPEQAKKLPTQITSVHQFAADTAPLDEMAQTGFEYVVVAKTAYERYFFPGIKPVTGQEQLFGRRKEFYEQLFAKGELVWSSIPSPPSNAYVNPELRVYRISNVK